ncbi:hypothetical protein ABZY36_00865 [Streptomyces sp. NPDC006627]|uniref:hypothetical protein n=1 Tax=Streptomyces sp. NPDC006627 TaxID=3154679 RepID=UPI0033A0AD18
MTAQDRADDSWGELPAGTALAPAGCAAGEDTLWFAARDRRMTAADMSAGTVREFQQRARPAEDQHMADDGRGAALGARGRPLRGAGTFERPLRGIGCRSLGRFRGRRAADVGGAAPRPRRRGATADDEPAARVLRSRGGPRHVGAVQGGRPDPGARR